MRKPQICDMNFCGGWSSIHLTWGNSDLHYKFPLFFPSLMKCHFEMKVHNNDSFELFYTVQCLSFNFSNLQITEINDMTLNIKSLR